MSFFSKYKSLFFNILLALGVGLIAAFFTKDNVSVYDTLVKPGLSPPAYLFPLVWTILYLLMGISAYLIYTSASPYKSTALKIYALQLLINALWPFIFFNAQMYLLAFLWLLLLILLVVIMLLSFAQINKTATLLQIPYLLWILFAAYLNFSIYLLNR